MDQTKHNILNEVLELTQFYIDKQTAILNTKAKIVAHYLKKDNLVSINIYTTLKKDNVSKMYAQTLFVWNADIENNLNLNTFLSTEQKELTNQLIVLFINKIKEKTGETK